MSVVQSRRRKLAFSMFATAALFTLAFPQTVWAHKVQIWAIAEGRTVTCSAYFADGKKARNSKIEVYGPDGNMLLEGKTDENGSFSFEAPFRANLKIILIAGMGHRAEYTLKAEELPESLPAPHVSERPCEKLPERKLNPETKAKSAEATGAISEKELRKIISEVVSEKLKPVNAKLAEAARERGKRSLMEILGGVGIIFGIMGLVIFFRSRRRRPE